MPRVWKRLDQCRFGRFQYGRRRRGPHCDAFFGLWCVAKDAINESGTRSTSTAVSVIPRRWVARRLLSVRCPLEAHSHNAIKIWAWQRPCGSACLYQLVAERKKTFCPRWDAEPVDSIFVLKLFAKMALRYVHSDMTRFTCEQMLSSRSLSFNRSRQLRPLLLLITMQRRFGRHQIITVVGVNFHSHQECTQNLELSSHWISRASPDHEPTWALPNLVLWLCSLLSWGSIQ